MKKNSKFYKEHETKNQKQKSLSSIYGFPKNYRLTKEFTYNEFKKIAAKTDFTQKEWSDILHISERTLQRYSKENSAFSFSLTDRILQIDKVIKGATRFLEAMKSSCLDT